MPGMQGGRNHVESRWMRPAPHLPQGSSSHGVTLLLPGLPRLSCRDVTAGYLGPDDNRVIESSESFPLFSDPTTAPHSPPFLFLHPDDHPRAAPELPEDP